MSAVSSIDALARGLTKEAVSAARYEGTSRAPGEIPAIMQSMMPENVSVLDVGCGPGSVTIVANADKGNSVMGLEPDEARAKVARHRGLNVLTGFLNEEFVASHELFDVVVASDVMEHTANPAEFLSLIRSALKPGGLVLLSVPNVAHWSIRMGLMRGRWDYTTEGLMDATHLRWFTMKTLTGLLASEGFEVLRSEVSVGSWLPEYKVGLWKMLPKRRRDAILGRLTRISPMAMGCQLVVQAKRSN